ncbi:hypothetical protein [Allorhizocola rhizosphaerae]|uniref:hypothetical protein n=1 Tax=Allorhizocola rhizosphaerae TaxID=1872709 RepID=UPI000E3D077C|nr:hypothetical protein [Allorhizocola rhizosphaerae]
MLRHLIETGRLPLFGFFSGVVIGFLFIRASVRLIRAQVRWWPGNVKPGGLHIHHAVFGVVFMLIGGVAGLIIPSSALVWNSVAAFVFGVGAALVLDEFALILHLDDVYWQEKGRTSIDAVFVAVALTGLLVLGLRPVFVDDLLVARQEGAPLGIGVAVAVLSLVLAVITLLKGKIWTGLLGIFLPFLLYVGAIRLARPGSPWARWRYPRSSRKLARAQWRESRLRRPLIRAKIWVQELLAGRHNLPPPGAQRAEGDAEQ